MILNMPTERREAHAHVEPGQLHATYISRDVSQNRRIQHRHVVQVPATAQVMLQGQKHSHSHTVGLYTLLGRTDNKYITEHKHYTSHRALTELVQ